MIRSQTIFRRDAKGKTRQWHYEVDGDKWRGCGGLVGGKQSASGWSVAKAKNVGRANATTPEEQAAFEAEAEFRKKLDREYRRHTDELDSVPPAPMLAREYKKMKEPIDFIGTKVFSQPKLDGIRAMITGDGATSREYQPHHNVGHIIEALEPVFIDFPSLKLDGELYNHDLKNDFNSISSIVRTQNVEDADRERAAELIQFHVYDCVPPHGPQVSFYNRFVFLTRLSIEYGWGNIIRPVPTVACLNQTEIDERYAYYLDKEYEGQMVRIDGPYEHDTRSKTLWKRKERETAEFRLLAIEEGNGNWAGCAKRAIFAVPAEWPSSGETMQGVWANMRPTGAGIRGAQPQMKKLLEDAMNWDFTKAQVTIEFSPPTPDGIPRFPVAIDFHPEGRKD